MFWDNYKSLKDEPMKNHCTFRVGGKVDVLVLPQSVEEFIEILKHVQENNLKYFVLGNGSNIIPKDEGFKGIVIKTTDIKYISLKEENEDVLEVACGNILKTVCLYALENSLSGLEFAYGIPGTVGGSIYMNAGAYGGEIKDCLIDAIVYDGKGIKTLANKDLKLSYRHSILQENNIVVLSARFKLKNGNKNEIKAIMDENLFKRNSKQPVNKPSAGSAFKRPDGYFAGKLIMDSNLRGCSIGGAQVSEKHCGFIINSGNATSKDILDLIEHVQNTVYEKFNVFLEPEVRILE
ncbi:MAG: UDP-N-acetylmuramate dehydrogenase [Lachnospirales bacterium]